MLSSAQVPGVAPLLEQQILGMALSNTPNRMEVTAMRKASPYASYWCIALCSAVAIVLAYEHAEAVPNTDVACALTPGCSVVWDRSSGEYWCCCETAGGRDCDSIVSIDPIDESVTRPGVRTPDFNADPRQPRGRPTRPMSPKPPQSRRPATHQ